MRLRTVTLRTLCGCTQAIVITEDVWRRGQVEIEFVVMPHLQHPPPRPERITPMRRRFVRQGNGEFLEQL